MKLKQKTFGKRTFAIFLTLILILSVFPVPSVLAEGSGIQYLQDVGDLLTKAELAGVYPDDDGSYHVHTNESYNFKLTFKEIPGKKEMDMTADYIYFNLPNGIIVDEASGKIDIGVKIGNSYNSIYHDYVIVGNQMMICWNKEDANFENLSLAGNVEFEFGMSAEFDGSVGGISFGDGGVIDIKVDNTGSVTITKNVTGLKTADAMSDEDKKDMTFELRDADGSPVQTFTYADMTAGSITFSGIEPGTYTVVETNHPEISLYTFNGENSVTEKSGPLSIGGQLNLALKNDYKYDNGSLELNKTVSFRHWDGSDSVPQEAKSKIRFNVKGPNYDKTFMFGKFDEYGKLTLTGLDIGEYTITESSSIEGYNWTCKVNDNEEQSPATKVTVTKNGTAAASFENIYVEKTVNLTIQKDVSGLSDGDNIPSNTEFTVTYPDGSHTKTFTYSQMTDGKYTIEGVPLGTYTVTEKTGSAEVANYKLKVSGSGSFTVSDNTTKVITNTYSPYGSLKIAKTVEGDLNLTNEQQKAITFDVYDSNNKKVEGASRTYYQIKNGNDTIDNLPVGNYTIRETAPDIKGYTLETKPSDQKVPVTVTKGNTVTSSFTNTYTKDVYKITVKKVFGDGSYNADNLPDTIKDKITFTIKDSKDTVVKTCEYKDLTATMTELAMADAGPYTISESNTDLPAGLQLETEVSVNDGAFSKGSSISDVTLRNHQTDTITFRNTYTIQGKITGDKTVEGLFEPDADEVKKDIRFAIDRLQGGNYVRVYDGITLDMLKMGLIVPIGTYRVEEYGSLGVDGYNGPVISTQVDNGPIRNKNTVLDPNADFSYTYDFTVGQNQEVDVQFTNTYNTGKGVGHVALTKYVSGLDGLGADDVILNEESTIMKDANTKLYDAIKFKIERYCEVSENQYEWREYKTYTLDEMLTDKVYLRAGKYRITELNADIAGYQHHVNFIFYTDVEDAHKLEGLDTVEFEIEKQDGVAVVKLFNLEAHNVYTKLGNLKITKTITGELVDKYKSYLTSSRKSVKFHVTGPFGFKDDFTFDDIANPKANEAEKTYKDIPAGEYIVTEEATDTSAYIVKKTVTAGPDTTMTGNTVTVPVGGTAQIDFTNEYTHKKGNLMITKTMAGEVPVEFTEEQKKAMSFQLYKGTAKIGNPVTYNQFEENGTYTFTDLDTGSDYKVVETIGDAIKNSYTVTISEDHNKAVTVSHNQTKNVKITNTFLKIGTLNLEKSFSGADISSAEKNTLQFEYYRVDNQGVEIDQTRKTVSYNEFTNGKYSTKVVPGNYVVLEKNTETGYIRTTTVSVDGSPSAEGSEAPVTITFGGSSLVEFSNNYEEVASLKITKKITGDLSLAALTEEQAKAIIFTVTDVSGNPVKDMEGNDVKSFSCYDIMKTGTKTINNLKPGGYKVTETINDSDGTLFDKYICTTTYQNGSAPVVSGNVSEFSATHGENTVAFTNKYDIIPPLSVEKTSSSTYVGLVMKDGLKYPVWRFELDISNMNTLTTRNGTTTFTDVFDGSHADWFRLATKDEVMGLGIEGLTENYSIESLENGKAAPDAVFNEADSSIVISNITEESAGKCKFTYYLIAKDSEAVAALSTPAEGSKVSGNSHVFKNAVTYHPMPNDTDTKTVTADYKYEFTAVSKAITNLDEDDSLYDVDNGTGDRVDYADFSITLNKDGVSIGNRTSLVAVDKFSENQTVVISSLKTNPEEGVRVNVDNVNHELTIEFPNGTPVTVSYRVNITHGTESMVTLSNNVEVFGFVGGVNKDVNIGQGGSGGGSLYTLNILKVNEANVANRLSEVGFELHDGTTDDTLTTFTTDTDGKASFYKWGTGATSGSFIANRDYYLIETNSLDGFNREKERIWFRFSDDDEAAVSNGVTTLKNNEEFVVKNEPVTADLKVTKSFNAWDKQDSFSFKLEPVDGAPMPATGGEYATATQEEQIAAFGKIHFVNGIGTYSYTIQEVVDDADKVDGITYDTEKHPVTVTVTDTDNDGVKEVAVVYDEDSDNLTITNTYSEGALTVSKTVTGNDADKSKAFDFKVTLTNTDINGEYGDMVFEGGVATFALKNGESRTANGIPNGIGYTVTEESDGYISNYPDGITGVIDAGNPATAAFTNTRNTFGSLKVTKKVAGNAGDKTRKFDFTVTLTDSSGAPVSGEYGEMTFDTNGQTKFKLADGETKILTGLPNGATYSVMEDAGGYDSDKPNGITGTISGDASAQIPVAEFTNTLNTYGELTVTKTVAGNAGDEDKEFDFTVKLGDTSINGTYGEMTFENGVAEFMLKDGGSLTAKNLPNGLGYKVEEDDYTADGYVSTQNDDAEGYIVGGGVKTAAFTNTRNAEGSLTISKKVAGNAANQNKEFTFNIELTPATSGTFSDVVFDNDGKATVKLKHNEVKTIEGLPNGTKYAVTEAEANTGGYETTSIGANGTISETAVSTAAFTNTRNAEGSLKISKTVAGNAGDKNKEFTFNIELTPATSGTFSDVVFDNDGKATVKLKHNEVKTIEGLPNGTKYAVTEAEANTGGYETTSIGANGTISETAVSKAEFTNTRNTYGDLVVTKTVAGNAGDKDKEFDFTVTLGDTSINGTYGDMTFENGVAKITLKHGETMTAKNLPNGIGYTVTESDYTDDGYVMTKTGDSGTISETATSTAAFTNTRNAYGDLVVTKTVAGNAGDKDKEFDFTVKLGDTSINGTYGDMTFENGVAEFTLKHGETRTAKKLPNGTKYTVTEAEANEGGYVTTKTGDEGTISETAVSKAEFTNTRNTYGDLSVTKTVAGNAGSDTKEFGFKVTLTESLTGTYGGMEFKDGVAVFTLKHGETRTAKNLPNGIGYTVTESDYTDDGYVTTKTGDSGTISETATSTAEFTNTRDTYGDLVVTKTVAGNAGDKDKEFDFTVTLGDTSINGTHGDMTFENGVAEFTLKHGETRTAKKLPNGTKYTVTEIGANTGGYVTTRTGDEGTIVENDVLTAKFTNTKNSEIPPVPKTVTVSGSKTWDDVDNRDGLRPSTITIKLLKNGKVADSKVVSEANNWSWSFTNLPENEDGQRIIYSIRENAVESYSAEYDGYNVTNHYTPGKVSVTVTKIWNDSEDLDGIRPDSVIVKLFADKEDTGKTLVLNSSGNWKGTFSDLDEYKEGKKITYTIEEERVTGYDSVITGYATVGYVITNSHTPKETPDKPDVPKDNPKKPDNPEYYDNPKTGDESNLFLWLALWLVSGGALAGIAIHWRKRKKAE